MCPAAHNTSTKSTMQHNNKKRKAFDPLVNTILPFLIDGLPPLATQPQIIASKGSKKREINDDMLGEEKKVVAHMIDLAYPSLICPCCLQESKVKTEADEHMKAEHKGVKMFECLSPLCNQIYTTKGGLKYHVEHVHHVVFISSRG
ncbi:hypothetical protein EDC96DRAFT_238726 [Choanephora cucurbitarum]|nr:hypothetical protein EDC96DRAFT_238726 [Choanephora cucurbitarum]